MHPQSPTPSSGPADPTPPIGFLDIAATLAERMKLILGGTILVTAVAVGASYLMPVVYTATTTFMPPQQQQTSAASALQSLGALAGIPTGVRAAAEQYVSLMQSANVGYRLVEHFNLQKVYEKQLRSDARAALKQRTNITIGRKDGLISVAVDDTDPQRAADIANRYVEELRRLTSVLAVTEAQQRRVFFEKHLADVRKRLVEAQEALQASGFSAGALKAEPRAAAESYAALKAEAMGAEIRLQALRNRMTDAAPEVRQQLATLSALRAQLARAEQNVDKGDETGYVGRFREFKYQETLFELFARQYELAKVDESREGTLIQVVDSATPPEKRSKPERRRIATLAFAAGLLLLSIYVLAQRMWERAGRDPQRAGAAHRLAAAFGRRRSL